MTSTSGEGSPPRDQIEGRVQPTGPDQQEQGHGGVGFYIHDHYFTPEEHEASRRKAEAMTKWLPDQVVETGHVGRGWGAVR